MDIQSPDSLVDYFHHFADHLAFPFRTKPVGVGTIEAFSSAFFRRMPERQFRTRLCDSGQAPPRVEAQVVNDLTPPFVRFHFAAQSESHYTFSLHRFRASQRDMKAPQKINHEEPKSAKAFPVLSSCSSFLRAGSLMMKPPPLTSRPSFLRG